MENQRIRLSKSLLKSALIELLSSKDISKITVYELCAKAEINRTTFYKYYGNPYDLLADIESDLFLALQEYLAGVTVPDNRALCRILEFLLSERDKFITVINAVSDKEFAEKLFTIPLVHQLLFSAIFEQYDGVQGEYVYLFFCHGCYAIVKKWLNDGGQEDVDTIAALIYRLARQVLPE